MTLHLVALEHAGHGEDVADVVVDDQHLLAGQHLVGLVQPLDQLRAARRAGSRRGGAGRARLVDQPLRATASARSRAAPAEPIEPVALRSDEQPSSAARGPPAIRRSRTGAGSRPRLRSRGPAAGRGSSTTQSNACASRAPRPFAGPRRAVGVDVLGRRAPSQNLRSRRPASAPITSSSRTADRRARPKRREGLLERLACLGSALAGRRWRPARRPRSRVFLGRDRRRPECGASRGRASAAPARASRRCRAGRCRA